MSKHRRRHSIPPRGQIEISFQWIYVVVAGGAFLLIFYFAFKGITHASSEKGTAISLRSAQSVLSTAQWQPDAQKNESIGIEAGVRCIGGLLTLSQGDTDIQLQRAAAFMPRQLSGDVQIVSREVALDSDPAITYGSVTYVDDDRTYYYMLGQQPLPVRHAIATSASGLAGERVPGAAAAIVIVAFTSTDLSQLALPKTNVPVYGVVITQGKADFYVRDGARLKKTSSDAAYTQELLYGAAVSADAQNYACAKAAFEQRADDIITVYSTRLTLLPASPECDAQLRTGASILQAALAGQRQQLFSPQLRDAQESLHRLRCPVIA